MEIPHSAEDDRTAVRYPLLLIRPLARELDTRLNSLRPSVHRENHFIAKELRNLLGKGTKDGVVECPRGEGQTLSLLHQGCHDAWVAMALVDGAASGVSTGT